MIATGVGLALTISCKMVGLFTFLTVGTAVLVDLWGLLDIKRGHTIVGNDCIAVQLSRIISLMIIFTPYSNTSESTFSQEPSV